VGLLTALLTAFYTFRAFFRTFWGEERIPEEAGHHAHESPPVMYVPLIVLAVFALFIGAAIGPTGAVGHFLERTPGWAALGDGHAGHNYGLMIGSSLVALIGVASAWWLYGRPSAMPHRLAQQLRFGYELSLNKFWFDELYAAIVVRPLVGLAQLCRVADYRLVDGAVRGVAAIPAGIARWLLRPLQNGLVQLYALGMVFGLIALLVAMWRRG
jgi:NADH-quinone oxidoreductase subunit L